MRAVREQPRLALVRAFGAFCLIAVGMAIGGVLRDDGRDEARATQARLSSAQRSMRDQRTDLQRTKGRLGEAVTEVARSERALRSQRRASQRLRRELRIVHRARDRAKRRE